MATDQRKRSEVTSADTKILGFEYQYLYFIVKLLELVRGEEVGYEALDDVHMISDSKKKNYFYQIKHTIQHNAKGEQPNLTAYSDDLWKTLSNWSKFITDKSEGRVNKEEQKDFILKSSFVLVLNRNINNNEVIKKIKQFQEGKLKSTQISVWLKELIKNTSDESIKQYITDVTKLGATILASFIQRLVFINSEDDLIEQVREGIRNKMVPDDYVEDILAKLYFQLKKDFFRKVKKGQHQVITYTEWLKRYIPIFNDYKTTQLPIRSYKEELPDHLEEQFFVQELIEIGAIDYDEDGLADIADYTSFYIRSKLQLDDWYQEGRISYSVLKQFHDEAFLRWKNIHRSSHRTTKVNHVLDFQNAVACFDKILNEKLVLLSTELGATISNGEFIRLAEEEKIGWKNIWREEYRAYGSKHIKEQ